MPRRGLSVFRLLMLWAVLLVVGCDEAGDTTRNEDNNVAAAEGNNAAPAVSPLDQRWQTHLASLPTGTISARAPLIVRFNHPVASPDQLDKPQSGVVRLLPERPVTAVFTAEDRLEIRPLEPLPSGESLTLVLYAQGLANVDDTLSPAEFSLQVLRQQLSLSVASLLPTEDGREMVLRGSLETRDLADHDKVESVLAASQNGDGLTIAWQHDSAGFRHAFSVSGIVRKPQASDVLLRWDAAPLGLSNNGERHYTVPALKNFAVTNVRAVSYPQPHIQVNFSEALSATQNLKGLVTLNDNNVRVEVDGSTLRIYPQEELDDDVALVIDASLRSASQGRLAKTLEKNLTLVTNKPGVRFVGEGTILPDGKQLSVPFEAVGVRSVKVQAFRVFDDNIGRYLQGSELNEADMDSRTGRYLWQKTLSLPGTGDGWQRYQLDLTELMAKHPNGLVHLTLAIDGDDISYHCPDGALNKKTTLPDNYEGPGQDDGGDRKSVV